MTEDEAGLIQACIDDDAELIHYLVKVGVNVDVNDGEPLLCAAWHANYGGLAMLVYLGANTKARDGLDQLIFCVLNPECEYIPYDPNRDAMRDIIEECRYEAFPY